MKAADWHRRLVRSGPTTALDYAACLLLFPMSIAYGIISAIRVVFYRSGWLRSMRAPVPVIAIGNLAVGGTGKTPVTDVLVRFLVDRGIRTAVVSRGYGRRGREAVTVVSSGAGPLVTADEGGDEPVLLAQRNPRAIVIVAADRRRGVDKAVTDYSAEVVLLDDGFQHLRVRRDLDLLLLDARKPFGNGYPLPLGNLREFPAAANRADLVLLTRSRGDETLDGLDRPVVHVGYRLAGHARGAEGHVTELSSVRSRRIGAFAGIADPGSFFGSLSAAGIEPVETVSFGDHAVYGKSEQLRLRDLASRCDVLLTTEKDLVKLRDVDVPCDCLAVPLELDFRGNEEDLLQVVEKTLQTFGEMNMLPDELMNILACPKCKGPVDYDRTKEQVICESCKLAYPVRDGIPVMLVDEAFKI